MIPFSSRYLPSDKAEESKIDIASEKTSVPVHQSAANESGEKWAPISGSHWSGQRSFLTLRPSQLTKLPAPQSKSQQGVSEPHALRWTSAGWVKNEERHEAEPYIPQPETTTKPALPELALKWTPGGRLNANANEQQEAEPDTSSAKGQVVSVPDPEILTKAISNNIVLPNKTQDADQPPTDNNTSTSPGTGNVPNQWDEPPPLPTTHIIALPTSQQVKGASVPNQWEEPPDEDVPTRSARKPLVFTAGNLDGKLGGEGESAEGNSTMAPQWEDAPGNGALKGENLAARTARKPLVFMAGDLDGKVDGDGEPAEEASMNTLQWEDAPELPASGNTNVPTKPTRKPLVFHAGDMDGKVAEDEDPSAVLGEKSTMATQWQDAQESKTMDRRPLVFTAGDLDGKFEEKQEGAKPAEEASTATIAPLQYLEPPWVESTSKETKVDTTSSTKPPKNDAKSEQPVPVRNQNRHTTHGAESPRPSTATSGSVTRSKVEHGKEGSVKGRSLFTKIRHSLRKASEKQ